MTAANSLASESSGPLIAPSRWSFSNSAAMRWASISFTLEESATFATDSSVERASYSKGCIVPTLARDRHWCSINISADGFVHLRTSVKLTFGPFASYRFVQRVSSQRNGNAPALYPPPREHRESRDDPLRGEAEARFRVPRNKATIAGLPTAQRRSVGAEMLSSACLFAVPIANRPRRRVIEDFGMRARASAQEVFTSWIALTTTSGCAN